MRRVARIAFLATISAAAPIAARAQAAGSTPPVAPGVLTLGTVARLAARQATPATIAGIRAEAAASRALQARASLLPSISAVAADGQRTFNTASFGLSFPGFDPNGQVMGPVRTVDVRGRVQANLFAPSTLGRYRAAMAAVDGADAEAKSAAEAAAANAANAYVRLLRAEAQVQARAADSSLAAELLGIAGSQLRAGTGIGLDVTRAQAALATVRTQLIGARSERNRARIGLLGTLALPVTSAFTLGDSLAALAEVPVDLGNTGIVPPGVGVPPVPEGPVMQRALDDARRTRPDLIAAQRSVETARRTLGATRAEALPTLALYGDEGITSKSYAHLLNTYTLGLQLSIPVWEGGRREGRLGEQGAALREAEARLRDLEAQVEADVAMALMDFASARELVEASRDRLRLAEQEVAQARERFRAGVAGNADVIAAQLALDAARGQHIDVQSALLLAQVALARAEGRVTQLP